MLDRRAFLSAAALAALAPRSAGAQSWPARPVRLIVPYAPGGTTDAVARISAEALSRVFGQNVFIENRAGQGTNIGAEFVARAEPDGYTLLVATSSTAVGRALYRGLKYDFLSDLAPVSFLVTFPLLFYVPASSPAKTIADVIALARQRPGGISYGTPGVGTILHLTGELIKRSANIQMTHVPYRGDALAIVDTIAGRLDLQIASTAQLDQARAGHVRVIGTSTAERLAIAPEIPPVAQTGLPGFDVRGWFALMAPGKTPPDLVNRLSADTIAALTEPTAKSRLEAIGTIVAPSTPAALATFLRAEVAKWETVVKEAGIQIDG
ncbi:MAG: tripartite tricarboxylate transporter substrate binding protein [Alphaproteobacteria bacterium]|nr:tripartite tricarboxylate transporter substrate binding protein [Alphaproteobacteria bacterium]